MKINQDIEDIDISIESTQTPDISHVVSYWPLIKIALQFVKIFTGRRADAKINQVIEWGDSIIK